jgi:hypothetical protein
MGLRSRCHKRSRNRYRMQRWSVTQPLERPAAVGRHQVVKGCHTVESASIRRQVTLSCGRVIRSSMTSCPRNGDTPARQNTTAAFSISSVKAFGRYSANRMAQRPQGDTDSDEEYLDDRRTQVVSSWQTFQGLDLASIFPNRS